MWVIEKLKPYYARISPYLAWGFPAKLLLSSLGAIVGAGFLGFLSNYATYWYAISIGVRPPLEGVPYLSAAVTFISLILMLTGVVIFAIAYLFCSTSLQLFVWTSRLEAVVRRVLRMKPGTDHEDLRKSLERIPVWIRVAFCLCLAPIFAASFLRGSEFMAAHWPVQSSLFDALSAVPTYVLAAILFFAVLAYVVPSSKWPISVIVSLLYFCAAIALLFQPNQYAKFLRVVGYGGGLPIAIQSKDADLQARLDRTETSLILRTNDTMIVLDKKNGRFLEIPKEDIVHFSYEVGGLVYVPAMLPE